MNLPGYKAPQFNLKHLLLFFLIAFGWSWFWWYLFIAEIFIMPDAVGTPEMDLATIGPVFLIILISPFGPTIASFVLTALTQGKVGVSGLWQRFWHRRPSLKWLFILLLYPLFLRLTVRLSSEFLWDIPQPALQVLSQPWLILPPFIASILHGGLSEEFGWRGYALPQLQTKFNALTAALILGFIEGCWHIPLTFMSGDVRFGMPLLVLIYPYLATGIIRAWIFNNTNGSILAAVLFHAAQNTTGSLVPLNIPFAAYFNLIHFSLAGIIVLLFGPKDLVRVQQKPESQHPKVSIEIQIP